MIKVVLSPDAVLDYDESFTWYAKRNRKSALELEDEVAAAIDRIAREHGACSRFDDVYQYTRLKRYPFIVVFRVEGDAAHIVAVAHTSRSPGYWKARDVP
jgi:toxin ParE1/3/4